MPNQILIAIELKAKRKKQRMKLNLFFTPFYLKEHQEFHQCNHLSTRPISQCFQVLMIKIHLAIIKGQQENITFLN